MAAAKKQTSTMDLVGRWAFIIGVIIAILLGLFSLGSFTTAALWILIILGLIVGFLNVTGHEVSKFLLAAVSLVIVTGLGGNVLGNIPVLAKVLNSIMVFVIPATIIVALKAIASVAQDD